MDEIQHWEFSDVRPEDEEVRNANFATTSVYGFGYPLYCENVISALQGKTGSETVGREGLRGLGLLIAMYLSASDGQRIALALQC